MGLRVRGVLVILSLLAVAALAVPLALTMADRRTAALFAERNRQLAELAEAAAMPSSPLQMLVHRYHDVYGEGVVVVDNDGQTLAARELSYADPAVRTAANHALVDAPIAPWTRLKPWSRSPVLRAAGVRRDGELVGAVVVAVGTATAAGDIGTAWGWVAVGCLALILLTVLVARGLTRWVLRPIDDLERAVAEMTEGITGPPANVAGPPELRHFTAAFNTMAQAVRASSERQRRLVADASHQLRNPLAAVRLRADTLGENVTGQGRSTYESMTGELDRLEDLLHKLLQLARAEELSHNRSMGLTAAATETTDLTDVVPERIFFWQQVAERQQQGLRYQSGHAGAKVQLARHDVEQLLDVAVDNALRYAGQGATVTVSMVRAGDVVDLRVSDDGPGIPDEDLPRAMARFWRGRKDRAGTGLGLAIAGEIAAGNGASMVLEHAVEGGLSVRYRLPVAGVTTC